MDYKEFAAERIKFLEEEIPKTQAYLDRIKQEQKAIRLFILNQVDNSNEKDVLVIDCLKKIGSGKLQAVYEEAKKYIPDIPKSTVAIVLNRLHLDGVINKDKQVGKPAMFSLAWLSISGK